MFCPQLFCQSVVLGIMNGVYISFTTISIQPHRLKWSFFIYLSKARKGLGFVGKRYSGFPPPDEMVVC